MKHFASIAAARRAGLIVPKGPRRSPASNVSELEESLATQIARLKLPAPKLQVPCSELGIPARRWRFDFGWPTLGKISLGSPINRWLLVEISGGLWMKSAHTSGVGISRDYEKTNAAQIAGHICLTFTAQQVKNGTAVLTIGRVLGA